MTFNFHLFWLLAFCALWCEFVGLQDPSEHISLFKTQHCVSKTLVESLVISTWLSPKDHELKAPSIGGLAHKVVYGYFFPSLCTTTYIAPEKNLRRYTYRLLYNMYYDTIKNEGWLLGFRDCRVCTRKNWVCWLILLDWTAFS